MIGISVMNEIFLRTLFANSFDRVGDALFDVLDDAVPDVLSPVDTVDDVLRLQSIKKRFVRLIR